MSPLSLSIVILALALVAIVVFLRLVPPRGRTAEIVGLSFLGIDAGMILGLSASPILATVITGIFTLAGTAVPLILAVKPKSDSSAETHARNPEPSRRYSIISLLPIAPGFFLGVLFGIFTRENDTFQIAQPKAPVENLRNHFKEMGFSDEEVTAIMQRLSKEMKWDTSVPLRSETKEPKPQYRIGGLLSAITMKNVSEVVKNSKTVQGKSEVRLKYIKDNIPESARELISAIEDAAGTPEKALEEIERQVGPPPSR